MKLGKNYLGLIAIIVLVIFLSQFRIFNFLLNTYLGRLILISFIIFISCMNEALGLIAILFFILAFKHYRKMGNIFLLEGFDNQNKDVKKNQDDKDKKIVAKNNVKTETISSSVASVAREGFCITDKETNMLRGKQSNSVPVFDGLREQSDDVSPSDKSVFTNDYSSV